ncbi:hypothetical protein BATDEDRAFT_91176 [Batrachochytrium dendrobatidis JAM81]|uniref:Uncharacterized protein n=1 Tax=Batrachochytrium dendrobatidis (strain JAM81 / FGSC 10211) TaxID=684364 RepID=F4P9Z6_BATDJ|nr:uncharacterized protein BATDEDRAFT_91176 [Batrachochytrium dendrobatidis JAM81]EGF78060.1 hypothetical protein BATDEDRAFT_91176 [Batrachochytrium dendrobatidis JAM81]|eukprot:XP_006681570.1 hypothetical protein BATDEDRAFT_91176 [Batrachochytrium dendrobatidis JAM81]
MKLAVAVLSSILLVCSVTTANPVNPSATTDTGASTSTFIPSTKGIGLGALDDALPDNVKHLLDKYAEIENDRNQQKKKYWLLKYRYEGQHDVVVGCKKYLKTLGYKSQNNDDPKHGEFQKAKLDYEYQLSKLDELLKSLDECESEFGRLAEKKWEIDKQIVGLVFGTPLDFESVLHQASLIKKTPSVKKYLKLKSFKYKIFGKKSGGRRKHKDLESSDEKPDEESGSKSNKKSTSKKRRASSKFMGRLGSLFQRPKREDREPLI